MIVVSGKLKIKAGKRDEFVSRSKDSVLSARENANCNDFSSSADPIEENRVTYCKKSRGFQTYLLPINGTRIIIGD